MRSKVIRFAIIWLIVGVVAAIFIINRTISSRADIDNGQWVSDLASFQALEESGFTGPVYALGKL